MGVAWPLSQASQPALKAAFRMHMLRCNLLLFALLLELVQLVQLILGVYLLQVLCRDIAPAHRQRRRAMLISPLHRRACRPCMVAQ